MGLDITLYVEYKENNVWKMLKNAFVNTDESKTNTPILSRNKVMFSLFGFDTFNDHPNVIPIEFKLGIPTDISDELKNNMGDTRYYTNNSWCTLKALMNYQYWHKTLSLESVFVTPTEYRNILTYKIPKHHTDKYEYEEEIFSDNEKVCVFSERDWTNKKLPDQIFFTDISYYINLSWYDTVINHCNEVNKIINIIADATPVDVDADNIRLVYHFS